MCVKVQIYMKGVLEMNIKEVDIDHLIEKTVKEKCEITISCSPENIEIYIEPWEPFEYKCPYKN